MGTLFANNVNVSPDSEHCNSVTEFDWNCFFLFINLQSINQENSSNGGEKNASSTRHCTVWQTITSRWFTMAKFYKLRFELPRDHCIFQIWYLATIIFFLKEDATGKTNKNWSLFWVYWRINRSIKKVIVSYLKKCFFLLIGDLLRGTFCRVVKKKKMHK